MISLNKKSYHNPSHKRYKRANVERVKYAPKCTREGYVEIDTIQIFTNGIRRYVFNAIDIYTKFEFCYCYDRNTENNAIDFVDKLVKVYPGEIKTIQTDNGSEYLHKFDKYICSLGIRHKYTYPRCPKINGCIERSNRTLRESFLSQHEYLIWYNTKRPHQSIGDNTPMDYMLLSNPECHMYWTRTYS